MAATVFGRRRAWVGLVGALVAGVLAAADPAAGQDRYEATASIRVHEVLDGVSGRVVRTVVEDPGPAEILAVQIALARAGYDPHGRDGVLDGRTRRALERFQSDRGLLVCGCLTYETIVALGIRPVVIAFPSAYGVPYGSGVVVGLWPAFGAGRGRFVHGKGRRGGSGVFVGHAPALGAGQVGRSAARPPRTPSVRPPRPAPSGSGTGSRIRPGTPARPARPAGIRPGGP